MRIRFEPGRISARQAAAWAGVKESTPSTWVAQGLIEVDGAPGYDLAGLLQLYLFSRMVSSLGFERARRAWLQVRDELRDWPEPPAYLKLVCGEVAPIAELASSTEQLDAIVSSGEPVRVLPLHPLIGSLLKWFSAETKAQWAAAARPLSGHRPHGSSRVATQASNKRPRDFP